MTLFLLLSFLLALSLDTAFGNESICHVTPTPQQCIAAATDDALYSKVMHPTLSPQHLLDLPGFTRSVYDRDHALITPESQVFHALPGWTNAQAAYLITPAMGAHFSMLIANMEGSSSSASPPAGVERFVFVVAGLAVLITHEKNFELTVNGYAYLPPHINHTLESPTSATLVIFERKYIPSEQGPQGLRPELLVGDVDSQPLLETPGEVFDLRKLLPSNPVYDFNIHVMDFQPGDYLNVKEVHYNQHGLLLLQGRGIYRLGDKWYPVQAGDVIWMAPFVPQWYAALGRTKSRYLLYKDVNREPLTMSSASLF